MKVILKIVEEFLIFLLPFIFIICVAAFLVSLAGCQEPPVKNEYTNNACYLFAECMYRNEKNPDKSVCAPFGQECRAIDRFIFCRDTPLPERIDFDKCWLLLNQK
jgi:hypothetical protein